MNESSQSLLADCRDNLRHVEQELTQLKQQAAEPEWIEHIVKDIRAVKAACGFYGLFEASTVGQAAESALVRLASGSGAVSSDVVSLLRTAMAEIARLIRDAEAGAHQRPMRNAELIARLDALSPQAIFPSPLATSFAPMVHGDGGKILRVDPPSSCASDEARVAVLIVGVAGISFALPLGNVVEIGRRSTAERPTMTRIQDQELVTFGKRLLALIRMRPLLGMAGPEDDCEGPIVVVQSEGDRFALAVSTAVDVQEVAIGPVGEFVNRAGLFRGTAIPADGKPILVLDVAAIAARNGLVLPGNRDGASSAGGPVDSVVVGPCNPRFSRRDGGVAGSRRSGGGIIS